MEVDQIDSPNLENEEESPMDESGHAEDHHQQELFTPLDEINAANEATMTAGSTENNNVQKSQGPLWKEFAVEVHVKIIV